jgi:antitoxin component of MazEF toxin-antitoxin module
MKTKVVRVGDERAIVVDPKMLEKLGIDEGTELEAAIEEGCLVIAEKGRLRRVLQRTRPAPIPPRVPQPRPPNPPDEDGPDGPRYGFPKKQPW